MESLLQALNCIEKQQAYPFAVYTSLKEQRLLNVPITKPLLIVLLKGEKELGNNRELKCQSGDFIFLSDSPSVHMRNIPDEQEYCALLIEFDYQDFEGLQTNKLAYPTFCSGRTEPVLENTLLQFVQSVSWSPRQLWSSRKREILQILCHMGYKQVLSMLGKSQTSYRLLELFNVKGFGDASINDICDHLAMSESTLRRKLKAEGTSLQEIKDQARFGLGLHLLQTSHYAISLIAEKCGYTSQSRFSERFKERFGLTPTELKKTKMAD